MSERLRICGIYRSYSGHHPGCIMLWQSLQITPTLLCVWFQHCNKLGGQCHRTSCGAAADGVRGAPASDG